jgi:peptidoglycan hydrolase-like protein with peptidoglycan-binding domain
MTKKFLAIFTAAFLVLTAIVVPFSGKAEESSARAQGIAMFEHSLYFGLHGNAEVSDLQELLTDQGFYAGPINGNFYLLTLQAVRKFQSANGVSATGFFGPKSRGVANSILKRLIGDLCMNEENCDTTILPNQQLSITTNNSLQATVGQQFAAAFTVSGGAGNYSINGSGDIPGLGFTGTYCPPVTPGGMARPCAQMISTNTITLAGVPTKAGKYVVTVVATEKGGTIYCITTPCPQPASHYGKASFTIVVNDNGTGGTAPTINGVSGPTTLALNAEGVWTIKASNTAGGSLTYRVDWGDQANAGSGTSALSPQAQNFVQTTTFAHRYAYAGVYNPTFYVMNEQGVTTKSSISVKVGDGATTTNRIQVLYPNGGETLKAGGTYTVKWSANTASAGLYERNTVRISLLQQVMCFAAPCNDPETIIADNLSPSQGGWTWTIPADMVGTYKVKVSLLSGYNCPPPVCELDQPCIMHPCDPVVGLVVASDTSDNYFRVVGSGVSDALTINSINPSAAAIGSLVTITGTGFTKTGNRVNISGGVLGSFESNGTAISFNLPSAINPSCYYSQPACMMMARLLTPGTYTVWVTNGNGAVSNSVTFTVTGDMIQ